MSNQVEGVAPHRSFPAVSVSPPSPHPPLLMPHDVLIPRNPHPSSSSLRHPVLSPLASPLISLPFKTALRLDLNSVVGLGLVLANLRFDSPVLVAAATVSVVLLVIRTIVGYLNARVSVPESWRRQRVGRHALLKCLPYFLPPAEVCLLPSVVLLQRSLVAYRQLNSLMSLSTTWRTGERI